MPLTADNQQERLDARLQIFLFEKQREKKLRKTRILRDFMPEIISENDQDKVRPL
jgi:hypothetical protein